MGTDAKVPIIKKPNIYRNALLLATTKYGVAPMPYTLHLVFSQLFSPVDDDFS